MASELGTTSGNPIVAQLVVALIVGLMLGLVGYAIGTGKCEASAGTPTVAAAPAKS